MPDQRFHRGIESIPFPQLNREAFGEIAGTDPRRIEILQDLKHRFDFLGRRAQLLRHD
jgi:hypothetical protein